MSAYPGLDADMLPLALIVVILGGVGSLFGAFVGSFIIGFIYTFGMALLPDLAYVILFLPMIVVIAFRPQRPVRTDRGMKPHRPCRAVVLAAGVAAAGRAASTTSTSPARSSSRRCSRCSLNLLVGYGGLTSLGHAAYLGVCGLRRRLAGAEAGPRPRARGAASRCSVTTADGRAVRPDRAARHRPGLPDAHAGAVAGAVGPGLSLGLASPTATTACSGSRGPQPVRHRPRRRRDLLLVRAGRSPRRGAADGALRPLAFRRQPARHPRPAAPHERAGLRRLADPLDHLRLRRVLGRRWPACCTSTTTSTSIPSALSLTISAEALLERDRRRRRARWTARSSAPRWWCC